MHLNKLTRASVLREQPEKSLGFLFEFFLAGVSVAHLPFIFELESLPLVLLPSV
jgi:hypothetical protein